jgi:hypothetical protein
MNQLLNNDGETKLNPRERTILKRGDKTKNIMVSSQVVCLLMFVLHIVCAYDIEKLCSRVQDLNYKVVEYCCRFDGRGLYYFDGVVNKIVFNRLDS